MTFNPRQDPERSAIKVLSGAPQTDGESLYDAGHALEPLPPFTLPGAKKIWMIDGSVSPTGNTKEVTDQDKALQDKHEIQKLKGQLHLADRPIVLFDGEGEDYLALSVASELSKDGIFVGLTSQEEKPDSKRVSGVTIFSSAIILDQAVKLDLVTDFTSELPKIKVVKPYVIIGQSETLPESTLHKRAARLPQIIDVIGENRSQRKKILIDATGTNTSTDVANALGNPLSWQGQSIGGFVLRSPSSETEAKATIKHLTDLMTVRKATARRNGIVSAFGAMA